MSLNCFSFKMVDAAIKQSSGGTGEENYKNRRTSRSQSAASSEGGMQGRAVRQETSVLTIALFVTGCVTLGYLLGSSCLSFVSDKVRPDLASSTGRASKPGRRLVVHSNPKRIPATTFFGKNSPCSI